MKLAFRTAKTEKEPAQDIARAVLLHYLQSWGQTAEERGEALIQAGRWCGFNCHLETINGQVIPQVGGATAEDSAENLAAWQEFRAAIERCWPIGSFEAECDAIVDVLHEFQDRLSPSTEKAS